ncbi:MAG: glycosyltransferase family 39 protein [Pirellulales bacterium]|nr:glycosyltransferase family 39 protein [Pirellulales bacterium]
MQRLVRDQLIVLGVAGVLAFVNLGSAGLFDEDEPKNAACGQEMFDRGDWIVPTFNHDLRTDKPILLYWLMLASYHLLGVNEFAARLPSALLAVGTSLVTYHLGRRLYGPLAGLLAGPIIATSLNFDVVARAATPDSTFVFFCTLSILIFVLSAFDQSRGDASLRDWRAFVPRNLCWFVAIYAAMGLAALAKGPAGIVLPSCVMGLFLLVVGSRDAQVAAGDSWAARARGWLAWCRDCFHWRRIAEIAWAMRPWTALAVLSLIVLPWYIAVGIATDGAWLAGFLGKHNVGRFVGAMEGHSGPPFYYLVAISIGFFPWSVFLLPCFARWKARLGESAANRPADLLIVCWLGFYLVFFTLARTKLPNYVLPAYPALALATGAMLRDWLIAPATRHWTQAALAFGTVAAVGIGMLIALPVVSYFLLPGEWLLAVAGVAPLVGGLVCLRWLKQQRWEHALAAFVIMAALNSAVLFGFVAARASRHQTSETLIALAQRQSAERPRIAAFDYFEPSLAFYARQQVGRFHTSEEVEKFFAAHPRDGYLITHEKVLPQVEPALPPSVTILARRRRFLRKGDVVLIGRPAEVATQPHDRLRRPQ